mgnify:CR=1 FL=1
MQVHYGFDKLPSFKNPVVTSGTFDGVHKGHQVILKRLKEITQKHNGESIVLTFWPHPRYIVQREKSKNLQLLNTLEEKTNLLKHQEIDHLIVIPFTKEFSQKSSLEFIQDILINKIKTKHLVIGYDHRFGKNREGSFDYIINHPQEFPFEINEIPRQDVDNIGVSSTKIREALTHGKIEVANNYLGEYYTLIGNVVTGSQNGRKINFPTANIEIKERFKLIPAHGVYAVEIEFNNKIHIGMLNIGIRPTLNGETPSIEVHIFGFNQDIYKQKIQLNFIARIRNERKFENLEALKLQLEKDKESVLNIIK